MKLNLHLLRIFYQLVESQSFTKAAEKLFISQSAVSKAIKELETQLELPLVERNLAGIKKPKTIVLTNDGKALYEHARAIFSLERMTIDDLQARIGLKQGKLTIGASTTVASYWLAPYLTAFHQQYPAIEISLRVGNTEHMRQALVDCDIDLAIVEGLVEDQRIISKHWQQESLSIITPPHSELTVKELNEQLWLIREQGSGTYKVTEHLLQQLKIKPKHFMTIGSNEGIARMVACGAGIALLPSCVVEDLQAMQKIAIFKHPQAEKLSRSLYLLTLKERPVSKLLNSFVKQLMS